MNNNEGNGGAWRSPTRSETVTELAIIAGSALVLALAFPLVSASMARVIPPCFLLTFTGLRCPLCGGTRCAGALARLDFAKAFYYNPMVTAGAAVCAYLFIRAAIPCFAKEYRPYRPKLGVRSWYVILAVVFVFFIVRNAPFYQRWFY